MQIYYNHWPQLRMRNEKEKAMISEKVTVINKTGLHARPANAFVRIALQYPCAVTIEKNGRRFNGKSIVSVLSACVKAGDEILLEADGPQETEALAALTAGVREGLGEA